MLRISLGIVFVWFGALKVFDVSPVSDLVARTVYWVDPDLFVPALGAFEMFVGLMLLLAGAGALRGHAPPGPSERALGRLSIGPPDRSSATTIPLGERQADNTVQTRSSNASRSRING